MIIELRDCQPTTLPTATPTPTTTPALFVTAQPMEAIFYSAFNQPGASDEGSGTGALRLTRIWLSSSGSTPQKTLYWRRDTNGNGVLDSGDPDSTGRQRDGLSVRGLHEPRVRRWHLLLL